MTAQAARTTTGRVTQMLSRFGSERPGLRELPFTVIFLVTVPVLAASTASARLDWGLVAAVLVLGLQAAASFGRWDRWPSRSQHLLPVGQLACVALLEAVVPTTPTYATVMLFLPVISLALHSDVLGVVLGTGATALATTGAAVAAPGPARPQDLLGAAIVTGCAGLVGAGVFSVTQRLRDRTAQLLHLQASQDQAMRTQADQHGEAVDLAAQLADARELWLSVVEAATEVAVLATDLAGRVLVASPGASRVLAMPMADLLGSPIAALAEPGQLRSELRLLGLEDSPENQLRVLVGAAADGQPEHREWTFVRADGEVVEVELAVTPRRALDEAATRGYLVVATDLTDRNERVRLHDEFFGLVSHELRTPLSAILGYLDLVTLDRGSLTAEQTTYLEVIERNARELLRLVDDLLLGVQVATQKLTLVPEPVDVVAIVRTIVRAFDPRATAAAVTVSLSADASVPLVTDPTRFGQLVENLLTNAVKFSHQGDAVAVSVRRSQLDGRPAARLVISDTGAGMTPVETDLATTRFYRSDDARQQRVRGLGLGLSVVDAVVQAHAGTLAIASEPGVGTTITVELPDLAITRPG